MNKKQKDTEVLVLLCFFLSDKSAQQITLSGLERLIGCEIVPMLQMQNFQTEIDYIKKAVKDQIIPINIKRIILHQLQLLYTWTANKSFMASKTNIIADMSWFAICKVEHISKSP